MITTIFASTFMLFVCLTASISFAQTETKTAKNMECCMMKDGKMMHMKDGKMMPMKKNMTMKNGTVCMTNGECSMKDGKRMMMKEGECMDMSGKMDNCAVMDKSSKSTTEKKMDKMDMASLYSCPMHPEVTSNKVEKCSKCGMDLVKKK